MTDPQTATPEACGQIKLATMPHPAEPERQVAVFRDWQSACRHLRNHLLASPECHAWEIVVPAYRQVLDPRDADKRWQYGKAAKESEGTSAQPLYDLYAATIRANGRDATTLNWHGSRGGTTVALGTDGVLMVVEKALTTAFLPGQGSPERVKQSQATGDPRRDASVERQRMRSGRHGHLPAEETRDQRRQAEREEAWTSAEQRYYRVFKPAVQQIRRSYCDGLDMRGNSAWCDYGLLKAVLPRMSRLKFKDWMDFRQQCGKA